MITVNTVTDVEILEGVAILLEKARKENLDLTLIPKAEEGENVSRLEVALIRAAQALKILEVIEKTGGNFTLRSLKHNLDGFKWEASSDNFGEDAPTSNRCLGADVADALGQLTLVLALNSEDG